MKRLRNTTTGVVVTVSDERAATLGAEWASVDEQTGSSSSSRSSSSTSSRRRSSSRKSSSGDESE